MKKLVFTRYDFENKEQISKISFTEFVASIAQAKFDEWFEKEILSAPVVYGSIENGKTGQPFGDEKMNLDTHKARLVMIEPIIKKCVIHEPSRVTSVGMAVSLDGKEYYTHYSLCLNCGEEIRANWESKEKVDK